ncbi:glycosyltransferase family 2 protein [Treponema porcinum]|uniref:Dolichol-phosphate mannosyltransferase n=1 Tax=Treponema porcinum TaxID=261392 RepID=A0A1T4MFG8_TREPO|nr:glycosyltransferase family 2 protein [Treponema porcinum]SJZ65621.1 dolichol-phosphate mannosyltransferase [Treponema porcinum]
MDRISLIVPCFNEEANIEPFYNAVLDVFKNTSNETDFELMFVNDGSKDNTLQKIKALHEKDNRVKCVSFSRNFGKEAALFAGIRNVTGNCAVLLDADLQHPPATIIEMYKKWKEGFEVVEGIKTERGKESLFHKAFTKIFYNLISRSVGLDMRNSSDYKLLDKKVITELANLKERNTFFRALSFWCGFKKTTVYYEVAERVNGTSKWSTKALIKYAVKNVICFSYAPLHIVTVIGCIFVFIGFIVAVDAIISFFTGKAADGFPTLLGIILLGFGGIMVSLGIIGVYIAQIYDEVKGRPQYIIGEKIE